MPDDSVFEDLDFLLNTTQAGPKQSKRQRLAERIADNDELVRQVKQLQAQQQQHQQLQAQHKDLQRTVTEVTKIYQTDKQQRVEHERKALELSARCADLEQQLEVQQLKCEKLQEELKLRTLPVPAKDMISMLLQLAQRIGEDSHAGGLVRREQTLLRKLRDYCKSENIEIPAPSKRIRPAAKLRSIGVQSESLASTRDQGTQHENFLGTSNQNTPTSCSKGTQSESLGFTQDQGTQGKNLLAISNQNRATSCTKDTQSERFFTTKDQGTQNENRHPNPPISCAKCTQSERLFTTKDQGTQHKNTTTTRGTTTLSLITMRNVGTCFPEPEPEPKPKPTKSVYEILKEMEPWNPEYINPLSPIGEPPVPYLINIGTCTDLCDVQRELHFLPVLSTVLKRSNSRPPSRSCVKDEMTLPPQGGYGQHMTDVASFCDQNQNLLTNQYLEIFRDIFQMLPDLLHLASNAGLATPTIMLPTPTAPTPTAPTAMRPTAASPTAAPPTAAPPTAVPLTAAPPTAAPPTAAPPTAAPPTTTLPIITHEEFFRVFDDRLRESSPNPAQSKANQYETADPATSHVENGIEPIATPPTNNIGPDVTRICLPLNRKSRGKRRKTRAKMKKRLKRLASTETAVHFLSNLNAFNNPNCDNVHTELNAEERQLLALTSAAVNQTETVPDPAAVVVAKKPLTRTEFNRMCFGSDSEEDAPPCQQRQATAVKDNDSDEPSNKSCASSLAANAKKLTYQQRLTTEKELESTYSHCLVNFSSDTKGSEQKITTTKERKNSVYSCSSSQVSSDNESVHAVKEQQTSPSPTRSESPVYSDHNYSIIYSSEYENIEPEDSDRDADEPEVSAKTDKFKDVDEQSISSRLIMAEEAAAREMDARSHSPARTEKAADSDDQSISSRLCVDMEAQQANKRLAITKDSKDAQSNITESENKSENKRIYQQLQTSGDAGNDSDDTCNLVIDMEDMDEIDTKQSKAADELKNDEEKMKSTVVHALPVASRKRKRKSNKCEALPFAKRLTRSQYKLDIYASSPASPAYEPPSNTKAKEIPWEEPGGEESVQETKALLNYVDAYETRAKKNVRVRKNQTYSNEQMERMQQHLISYLKTSVPLNVACEKLLNADENTVITIIVKTYGVMKLDAAQPDRVLVLLRHFESRFKCFIDHLLHRLEERLFLSLPRLQNGLPLKYVRFYLQLTAVQSIRSEHPARLLLAKIIFTYRNEMSQLVLEVLNHYPTVLPHREQRYYDHSDPLITVIKHLLMNRKYDMTDALGPDRILLSKLRFDYHFVGFEPNRQQVIENLLAKLNANKLQELCYAFALFCKRSNKVVVKNLLSTELFPLLNYYCDQCMQGESEKNDARMVCGLQCISMVLKLLPWSKDCNVSSYMSLYKRVLVGVPRPIVQQAAVQAILRTQTFGYNFAFDALQSYCPNFPMTGMTNAMVLSFLERIRKSELKG